MRFDGVPSVLLESEEVVNLFCFLAGAESELSTDLLRLVRKLEKAVSRGMTIEQMGQLRCIEERGVVRGE